MKVSKTTQLKALVLESSDSDQSHTEPANNPIFISLLKSCDLSVQVETQLSDIQEDIQFDFYFVNLCQLKNKQPILNRVLPFVDKSKIVLFNCEHDELSEKSTLLAGIQGIFYRDDRPDIILKGLESLKNNELWFKRCTMNIALAELLKSTPSGKYGNPDDNGSGSSLPNLTKREKTIIDLVSSGAQNKEIADQLNISPNTVKTHIYSIFRKTSSRNRIELISWSQQYQHNYIY
ncbi:response regulator transcription factor [Alteromonadaceae bacterium M269]|nr:response regulator transcription factor [Alteromonadaceae bacterium M269]